ncbi:hypothetical protein MBLNU13_g01444t1 [Cladosporium sp. NU13]
MSTFNGKVVEFPDIRIDHFRSSGDSETRLPLALFLSHVHSDHLEGLESCKSPFIYCSPATKEILLRLEKYPHRMNFAKGILEARKQTYKHLKKLLKTIPLETPTIIDLAPGRSIRVTLFDANHCVGAVMFLIEGDGKAVLYTGDIRSELWWVNNLARHPLMLAYVSNEGKAPLKQLDCIYLDTTFANKQNPYKHFPSKAEGTLELLQKVSRYPKETVFYFDTWTFGYEDVWMALCSFLNCQVHVDDYRYKLYRALATGEGIKAEEAARLFGYNCGNHTQEGCLTHRQTRLHSCEQGTGCEVFKKPFVRITPIISRHEGVEMAELGAGGGKGDLDQQHELEVGDTNALGLLMSLCATKMQDQPKLLSSVMEMLASIMRDPVRAIALDFAALHSEQPGEDQENITDFEEWPLESLIPALVSLAAKAGEQGNGSVSAVSARPDTISTNHNTNLPKQITFPYSRHSSYEELCYLIDAFKPKDIWPCTVDKANWSAAQSMSFLFGHLYDAPCKFTHDQAMFREKGGDAGVAQGPGSVVAENHREQAVEKMVNHEREARSSSPDFSLHSLPNAKTPHIRLQDPKTLAHDHDAAPVISNTDHPTRNRRRSDGPSDSHRAMPSVHAERSATDVSSRSLSAGLRVHAESPPLSSYEYSEAWKQQAFEAAQNTGSSDWNDITLVSVSGYHQEREEEL